MVTDGVPVVSLDHPEALVRALSTVGFAAVRNHGVPKTDLAAMRRLLVDLFAVDEEAKRRQVITRENYRGFIPLRFFSPNRDTTAPPDAFEGYKLHWECPPEHPVRDECDLYGSNRWPEHIPEMPAVVSSWWASMDVVADRVTTVLADAVGMDPGALAMAMEAPLTNTTLLH